MAAAVAWGGGRWEDGSLALATDGISFGAWKGHVQGRGLRKTEVGLGRPVGGEGGESCLTAAG